MQITDDSQEYLEDLEEHLPDCTEDVLDKIAERFRGGLDPMMTHVFFVQCQKCDLEFDLYAGQTAWCPECHQTHLK